MYLGQIIEQAPTESLFTAPLHPYTKALFSAALPASPDIRRQEIVLRGEVPSPLNPPKGCRFHVRCPWALDVCSKVEPALLELRPGHTAACHLYDPDVMGNDVWPPDGSILEAPSAPGRAEVVRH
jgi:peptide/nickel transport system ATP-binding protein/oligopeptide transport system ATP-binding protein